VFCGRNTRKNHLRAPVASAAQIAEATEDKWTTRSTPPSRIASLANLRKRMESCSRRALVPSGGVPSLLGAKNPAVGVGLIGVAWLRPVPRPCKESSRSCSSTG